jgi:hypothetical protein
MAFDVLLPSVDTNVDQHTGWQAQGWVILNMRFKRFLKTRFKHVFYFLKQGLAE